MQTHLSITSEHGALVCRPMTDMVDARTLGDLMAQLPPAAEGTWAILDLSQLRVLSSSHLSVIRDRIAPGLQGVVRLAVILTLPVFSLLGAWGNADPPASPETRYFSREELEHGDRVTSWLQGKDEGTVSIAAMIDTAVHYLNEGDIQAGLFAVQEVGRELVNQTDLEPRRRVEITGQYVYCARAVGIPDQAAEVAARLYEQIDDQGLPGVRRQLATWAGSCLYHASKFTEAVTWFERAIAASGHPDKDEETACASLSGAIGQALLNADEFERALPFLQADPTAASIHNLALTYESLGRFEEAAEAFLSSHALRLQETERTNPLAFENLVCLARVRAATGNRVGACAALDEAATDAKGFPDQSQRIAALRAKLLGWVG